VFSCGVALGVVGIALGLATPQLHLTPSWIGLLGAASLAGLFFGALAAGPVADRFGRRAIFGYNMAFLAVFCALQFFVVSSVQLLTLRLAIGFVLGTDFVVGKTVVSEFTPRVYRGRILGVLSIAWAGGFAFGYFVAYALRTVDADAWRWMLLASAVPCLPAFLLRVTIPKPRSGWLSTGAPIEPRGLSWESLVPASCRPGQRTRLRAAKRAGDNSFLRPGGAGR